MRILRITAAVGLTALTAYPAPAQELSFHGQVRPRYESRDPAGTGRDGFTSMRVRTSVEAALEQGLTIFVQVQDVRLWGEESNTLGDFRADNFDVHQAYLRYRGEKADWLTTTIGRQQTSFGGQRLVGAVDWTQQGRSFDGVRFDVAKEWGSLAFIGYTLADATAASHAADAELFGAYATVRNVGPGALDLYLLYDRADGDQETHQQTLGVRYAFDGEISGRVEGSIQTGDRVGDPVSAYMFGGRVGTTFSDGAFGVTAWYDYLSGDDDPTDGDLGVFSTLYATNHKFYGFADLFLNIPVHTAGAGLQDVALKFTWDPTDEVRIGADLHSFSATKQGSLSSNHFANELDLTLSHRYTPHLTMVTGLSFVMQGDLLGEIGRLSEDMTWGYVMFNAVF
jgi:hypothetical protein